MRNLSIGLLAILGLMLSVIMIYQGQRKVVVVGSAQTPPSSPYQSSIAGQGMIESAFKNIPIGCSYADVITEIYVKVGDQVKQGDRLFKTDTRQFEAQLSEALKDLAIAQEELNNQDIQFGYYKNLSDKSAVSKQAYTSAEYNQKIAQKRVEKAKATTELYKTSIERSIIKAPIDGEILQVNIRIGQYASQTVASDMPLILFGDVDYFHVRVDIDEEDSWRYEIDSPATAYVRGNKKIVFPLEYVYLEPYVIAKKSLTGSDLERVDTRVLQVVYRFKKKQLPVYLGELLDVYIQAKPHEVD